MYWYKLSILLLASLVNLVVGSASSYGFYGRSQGYDYRSPYSSYSSYSPYYRGYSSGLDDYYGLDYDYDYPLNDYGYYGRGYGGYGGHGGYGGYGGHGGYGGYRGYGSYGGYGHSQHYDYPFYLKK